MKKFEGKRLLLLGSNVGTLDLINYAKANGAYTIVVDNYPKEKSLAKQAADRDELISTGDINRLIDFIASEKINGIFTGVSEFNLLNAMKLCDYFGFPFYCTKKQWDTIEDKELFRSLCEAYQVPCPRTYYTGAELPENILSTIIYPVIVKPVDSSSSIGVSICRDKNSLIEGSIIAKKNSSKGRFIIEEYIEGEEFTAHYTIVNGSASLSCIDNRVPVSIHQGAVTTIPLARLYPSSFIELYISQVNEAVINMCNSLHLNVGVLFVQGFYNKQKNSFSVFEAGLRCAGEAPYRIIERVNGINFMNNFIDYALLGKVEGFDIRKDDPFLKSRVCCVTSFVSKGGRIGSIQNYENTVKSIPSIVDSECRYQVGDVVPDTDSLKQILLRFVLICNTIEQLIKDIDLINKSIRVLDESGNNLCVTFSAKDYYGLLHSNKSRL